MDTSFLELVAFAITTAVAIIAALFVVFHRNPVVNAMALVVNLACVAVFFLLLNAPFLAAVQIIVYAGAIMVLFLFVVMLLDLKVELHKTRGSRFQIAAGILGGFGMLWLLSLALKRSQQTFGLNEVSVEGFGSPENLARSLFTDHMIPFELASILLLVAMVGALMLAHAHADKGEG
ncbi:MAG: NADH-quinone oxidoreductase subunit J [Dehalococcoidia bacterium]